MLVTNTVAIPAASKRASTGTSAAHSGQVVLSPFIILAGSVPLAISGALLFSFLGLTTLNIYSQVGLITLVGLVSKNGRPAEWFLAAHARAAQAFDTHPPTPSTCPT